MMPNSWPNALLLSVIVVCVSALVWKGMIPSHALYGMLGAIIGWITSRAIPGGAGAHGWWLPDAAEKFSKNEIVTKRERSSSRPDSEEVTKDEKSNHEEK